MTTLKQALAILLGQLEPPWSTHSLRTLLNSKSVSLRSVIKAVESQKILMFLEIRPISLLIGTSTVAELVGKWSSGIATQDTLNGLASIFQPLGISIVYVSKDSQTIGILGTNGSLLELQGINLNDPTSSPPAQNQSGIPNLAQGAAAEGAGFAALAAAAGATGAIEAVFVIAGFLGFIAAGLFLGVAIVQLIAGEGSSPQPPTVTAPPQGDGDDFDFSLAETILGLVPDDLSEDVIFSFFEDVFGEGAPEPGQLPGAGDLAPGGDDSGGGGFGDPEGGIGEG